MSLRRGRRLTPDEQTLWLNVAKTARRHASQPHHVKAADLPPDPPFINPTISAPAPTVPAPRSVKPFSRTLPSVGLPAPRQPAPSGLDRATETRLRRGKRTPDARLDLHGMTAARAHAALIGFVADSRAVGHRCVLVITGKGGPADELPFSERAPGVLRREVPVWLATPPLSAMIVNVSPAHPKHGGGGALYVYLKRPTRSRSGGAGRP